MINTNYYASAACYLNSVPKSLPMPISSTSKANKVMASAPTYTGKRFNSGAGTKANFSSNIDICI